MPREAYPDGNGKPEGNKPEGSLLVAFVEEREGIECDISLQLLRSQDFERTIYAVNLVHEYN